MNSNYWILTGVWMASLACAVVLAVWRQWRLARQGLRLPVREKLLRGPGEGLRKTLEKLEDQISEKLAMAFIMPLFLTSIVLLQSNHQLLSPITIAAALVGIPALVFLYYRLVKLLDKKRNYRLGLLGERAVGEELNQLMLAGCPVFHDVPNEPYGNIDHVLIAPSGVYAVETKTRHKKQATGKDFYKVVFDGRCLRFAGGAPESQCLEQARQQASRLRDWLSKAIGEAAPVYPVVALPGWLVKRASKGEVTVVSGKEVDSLVEGPEVLDAAKIRRIAHQLDQRCRDVEF
jgi:hypothetical protein